MLGPEGREAIHKALGKNINTGIMQVLHEPGKSAQSNSYMWLYRTSGDTIRPIVLFDYQPGRGACYPKAFLKDFRGYLHTDGYDVYHSLPDEITVVGCWAHARRKFDEAMKSLPKGKAKNSSAAQGLATAISYSKWRKGWQTFLQKNAMTSGWDRQNLFWTLCWRGQIPELPPRNPLWARRRPTSKNSGSICSII